MTALTQPAAIRRLSATIPGLRVARTALTSDECTAAHWDALDEESREHAERLAHELHENGIGLLTALDDAWPAALDDLPTPPAFLFYRGNLELLEQPAIGICGSRHATERGLRAARAVGRESGANGMPVISGYARGVDTETHLAGLQRGAGTVIVLAEGITHFRIKRAFRETGLPTDRTLVLSQFPPTQRWTAGAAMTRNGVICALGKAMVVVEAGETGGTLNAGRQAMKLPRPVLALQFGDDETPPGNRVLFDEGALRISSTGELRAAIARIVGRQTITHP